MLLIALFALSLAAQTRLASDFEVAQMEKQLASSRGFEAQLSARLNLGDARLARNETALAREQYARALALAETERIAARKSSSLARYANATEYAALANAKLAHEREAFGLLEEALRYAAGDAETWNLYASAMRALGRTEKAISAARNAVAIAERGADRLDVAVYRHALATGLLDAHRDAEAERLLVAVTESLRSPAFDALRREVARTESFEVYGSARGDVAAYVSLLNRAQLRLAALYESRGDLTDARREYEHVLESRSDDVTALTALARLAPDPDECERRFAAAFDANPFSMTLIEEYRRSLPETRDVTGDSTGSRVRRSLVLLSRGDRRGARTTLDTLVAEFPENDTLRVLRREAEADVPRLPSATPSVAELRSLLDSFEQLSAAQRTALDRATYTSTVRFEGDAFEKGLVEGVPFRFSQPVVFEGSFDIRRALRLTYRILGVSRAGNGNVLLLEPLRLETPR
jgi:tetratricopeptide (TPR) repeat protein